MNLNQPSDPFARSIDTSPVFDSRVDELPYRVSVTVNGETIEWRKPLHDPFVHQVVVTEFSFRDRLKHLFTGYRHEVHVMVGARDDVQEAVLELDDNYRGKTGSVRRAKCDGELNEALRNHG